MDAASLRLRGRALHAARQWFARYGYVEVPTPVLVPSPALEATLFAVPAGDGWLRTSPEFALKRVLAAGLPRIYEIGPCFRDREHGPWHRREFTMLEWYRAGATLTDLMKEVESLFSAVAEAMGRPPPPPWRRTTVRQLFIDHAGVDPFLVDAATLSPADPTDWDGAFFRRWVQDVEPALTHALFVSDWPASQAALAAVHQRSAGPIAARFEAFLHGVELANAFQELIDPDELRRRFAHSAEVRQAEGEDAHAVDEALIAAVGRMPATSGIAVGFDRLVATLAGWPEIGRGRVEESG